MNNQTLDTNQTLNYRKQVGIIAIMGIVFEYFSVLLKNNYLKAIIHYLTGQQGLPSITVSDIFNVFISINFIISAIPFIIIIAYVFILYKKGKLDILLPIAFTSVILLLIYSLVSGFAPTDTLYIQYSTFSVGTIFIIIAFVLASISAFCGFNNKRLLYVSLVICGLVSGYSLITNLVGVYQNKDSWIVQVYFYLPEILSTVSSSLLYVALFTLGLKNKFSPFITTKSTNTTIEQSIPVQSNIEQIYVNPLTGQQYSGQQFNTQPNMAQPYNAQPNTAQPYGNQQFNPRPTVNQQINGQQCTGQVFDISQFNNEKPQNTDTSDAE